jgi:succinate dehydrogenase/fumarate reductase flavoprotein subunit
VLPRWLDELGLSTESVTHGFLTALPGFDAVDVRAFAATPAGGSSGAPPVVAAISGRAVTATSTDAPELQPTLERAAREHAEIRYGGAARRLVREAGTGRVTGVETVDGVVAAHRGVLLASGGFGFDEDLKRNHLKAYPMHFYGSPANTGDGVRMAQAAGAGLWHMNAMVGRGVMHFALPDGRELNFMANLGPPGYVIVDRYGRRFANEHDQATFKAHFYYQLLAYDAARVEYPRNPSFWIFDSRRIAAGPLAPPEQGVARVGVYEWSPDNGRELELGWIAKGATVAEAAAAAGVADPDAVEVEVEAYNRACRSRTDILGRPVESLVPLDAAPFYCVPLYAGGSSTCGGPRRDQSGRVLDPFGEAIPGLYVAGELGSVVGSVYPAPGAFWSDAMCFGQIAVETALTGP